MSNLTDLRDAISTELQAILPSTIAIRLTNQAGQSGSLNTTVLNPVCLYAAQTVRRKLGDVDETDYDAVDFGIRVALLRLTTFYSLTLTEAGAGYVAGVMSELSQEAEARRQGMDSLENDEDEDLIDLDSRYPNTDTWDNSLD